MWRKRQEGTLGHVLFPFKDPNDKSHGLKIFHCTANFAAGGWQLRIVFPVCTTTGLQGKPPPNNSYNGGEGRCTCVLCATMSKRSITELREEQKKRKAGRK